MGRPWRRRHRRSPANASSTTGHSAKHRAKQQGWALEVARQGQTAAPGRRRFPDGDWLGNGDGGWTVFQIPSTPGLESFWISGSKSRLKILKKFIRTEEEISKQPTKFQSHPLPVEGEIKWENLEVGWTVFQIPSTPVSLYVSSLASKPRLKKPEKIHGGWGFNGESPHQISDLGSIP